ncbi:hypothetical protein BDW59DRAFT_149634 [Aspergillus cavernicola]|uniref:BTB domain-containing protein n=1 Tax=Aspergillus cavernicola TaxID=176166 RepID=A0ABR4I5M6_9EURO
MPPKYLDKRTLSGGIVNLSVGDSQTPFDIHIELLCDLSPLFDDMLQDRFLDPSTKELVFPDDAPDVFADFVSWAYCGRISDVEASTESSRLDHLFQLWILAERFHLSELQDLVVIHCRESLDSKPS